ncbi:MAG TPA: right-handed parallel beta-helix repeat-containing protein, partial [Pyrinomonadaceae bacterium]|nr:right-handed parallel beta-helix repeat-containing protein [Pyrinomonadaceae bacterium]
MRSLIRMSNIAFATLLLSLLVFASQSVQAAPTVINTADAGTGSLRQAIIDATTAAAATTIDFNIPTSDPGYDFPTNRFTITLLTALPNIPLAPLTINNATGRGVTVKGGSSFRIFTLVNSAVVVINNLTISNGNSNGVLDFAKGGGIFMGDSATLTLNNCIVSANTATNGGGGIWVNNSGTLHVFDSTISNNTTTGGDGGGIRINNSGTLNITRSTVSGNHADAAASAGGGGGIYNGVSGTVNATNSTVDGNTAGNQGGGINNNATVTVSSSTISGNTATVGGGGIFNGPTFTATLNNSLVALNT